MGLFNRVALRPAKVMRAAGVRIDPAHGGDKVVQSLLSVRQEWQAEAWDYRDMVPELRFGVQYLAKAISRVSFKGGVTTPDSDDPVLFGRDPKVNVRVRKAVDEELLRLPLDTGYNFAGVLAENLQVTGEAWLHGHVVAGRETWEVLSVSEVVPAQNGTLTIRDLTGRTSHVIDYGTEEMLRLWVPHPRFRLAADSPMRALRDVCEEIVLDGREVRAAARSRVASNGMLLVPRGLTMLNQLRDDTDLVDDEAFMAQLAAVLLAPINNEGDAGAVVPAVVAGEIEDIAAVRHLRFERETSAELTAKQDTALRRLGRGMDIPPEILTGLGDSNHWSAWQIDASTFRYYIEPLARIVADSLTSGFLRPALLARSEHFTDEDIADVRVWFDAGNLTENPNRAEDAKDAFDRGGISYEVFRDALGFTEEDAPSDEEVLKALLFRTGFDPQTAAGLIQRVFHDQRLTQVPAERVNAPGLPECTPGTPSATPSGQPTGGTPTVPRTAPPGTTAVTAALTLADVWHPSTDDSRALMDIDRALRDRLLTAAEAAMQRALERAGAKVRSKAKAEQRGKLEGTDVTEFAAVLGQREVEFALGLPTMALLEGAFKGLRAKYDSWIAKAALAVANRLVRMLHLTGLDATSVRDQVTVELSGRAAAGWARMLDGLEKLAEKKLFHPDGDEQLGEVQEGVVPTGLVRAVLTHIGGELGSGTDEDGVTAGTGPAGGIAIGSTTVGVLRQHGAQDLGYEWVYGITPLDREFEPHRRLDGARFTTWTDPKLSTALHPEAAWVGPYLHPGDHRGCFIAGTEVSGPGAHASYVREYTGPGVKVVTADGYEFTATPNHPVLTPTGWVAAGKLQVGDEVVSQVPGERMFATAPQDHQMPAPIENVARALPMVSDSVDVEMPVAGPDFHGDGAGSEIGVIRADRRLLVNVETETTQTVREGVLVLGDVEASGSSFACSPLQLNGTVADRQSETVELSGNSQSGVAEFGSDCSAAPFVAVETGEVDVESTVSVVSLSAAGTKRDAVFAQYAEDGFASYSEPSSDSLDAHAGAVHADRIVGVSDVDLRCHVYNLATSAGWYIANGVIVHNCACDYVPVWAIPDYRRMQQELQEESPAMRDTRLLAELDDRAGRSGTSAQLTRDERDRIVALQQNFINRHGSP